MAFQLPDPLVVDPEGNLKGWSVQRNLEALTSKVDGTIQTAGTVTSLPTSPVNGQEVSYLADATNGVVWRFKYRAASGSTHKWEFIGGPPLRGLVDADETRANTAYGDLTTVGPDVTVPLAGDYDVHVGCRLMANAAAAFEAWMSYAVGASAALDADGASGVSSGQFDGATVVMRRRKTALAASTLLRAKYRTQVASTYNFAKRWLEVIPVRVS